MAEPIWSITRIDRRRWVGPDLDRLVGLADLASRLAAPASAPTISTATLARGAVEQPGADRVHPADAGDVEDEVAALQPVEPLRQRPEAREREIAGEAQHAPAVFLRLAVPGDRTHSRDMLQFPGARKLDRRLRAVDGAVP